jgi:hypothetical protein
VRRFGLIVWRTFALLVLLVGLGFTVLAAVGWLQTAHWKPLTVGEGLSSLPAVRDWIAHPQSWIGLIESFPGFCESRYSCLSRWWVSA